MQALLLPQPEKHARGEETRSFLPWGGSRSAFGIRTPNLWAQNSALSQEAGPQGQRQGREPRHCLPRVRLSHSTGLSLPTSDQRDVGGP